MSRSKVALMESLGAFINERRDDAVRDPLRVTVNASRPPILSLVCTGRLRSPCQTDEIIETEIMDKHVRDNPLFFNNDMKVVLDLRGIRDVYHYALDCNAHRWAGYLNVRAQTVIVVLPPDPILTLLQSLSKNIGISSMVPDATVHFVHRARDVAQFLGRK